MGSPFRWLVGRRAVPLVLLGIFLLGEGCATSPDKNLSPVDPRIKAELKEALKEAPQDELAKSYDPLSLLNKAEEFYDKKNYVEAAGEYEYFLNLHPLNRWASYAQYKLALCYFHQIRTVDRDLEPALKARSAFQKLIDLYPGSPFEEDAKEKIRFSLEHLARHEFYVGHFYYRQSAYQAAIARFSGIIEAFPESDSADEAMYFLSLSYQELGELGKAEEGLRLLLEKYPDTEYRQEAKRLLSKLHGQKT